MSYLDRRKRRGFWDRRSVSDVPNDGRCCAGQQTVHSAHASEGLHTALRVRNCFAQRTHSKTLQALTLSACNTIEGNQDSQTCMPRDNYTT